MPPIRRGTVDISCGEIYARWDVPRGALVLINDPNGIVKPIVTAVGETYTHEFVSESPDLASHSTRPGARAVSSCSYPVEIGDLQEAGPGATLHLNMGAVYNEVYGDSGRGIEFREWEGSNQFIWQLGDTARTNAIADSLTANPVLPYTAGRLFRMRDAYPPSYLARTYPDNCSDWYDLTCDGGSGCYMTTCSQPIPRMSRNGQASPYVLHQFVDIEGTHLGPSGSSVRNGSMSAAYCAYAYALGGPPMQPYLYGNSESWLAADEFQRAVFNQCVQGIGFLGRLLCGGDAGVCLRAGNMVLNCMVFGPEACGDNQETWRATVSDPNFRAWTVSPDRLGGHSRFASEIPPPTTWAADQLYHPVRWYAGGATFGCWR